jgi:glyoxylase I family protein
MFDFADPDGIQLEFLFLDPEKLRRLDSYSRVAESQKVT